MATQNKFTADLGIKTDADLQVDGSVTITGDLTVNGTQTTVNSTTTSVTDSLFELANSNTGSDTLDIGIYGNYDDGLSDGGASEYTGLFRDASDSTWKLFDGLEVEPTTTVNTSGTGYAKAALEIGDLSATTGDFSGTLEIEGKIQANNNNAIQLGGYGSLGQTGSGQMTILGHNARVHSDNNKVEAINNSWYASFIKQYYNQGISFHTTSSTVSGGDVLLDGTDANSLERMRITNSGEVVIGGTEIPSAVLDGTGAAGALGIGNSSELYPAIALMSSQRDWLMYQNSTGNFQIYDSTENKERFRIEDDGKTLFQPTLSSDGHGFFVETGNSADTGIAFGRNGTNNLKTGLRSASNGSSSYTAMKLSLGESAGSMATSSPQFIFYHNGNFTATGSVSSDRRLKENIVDIPDGSTEFIKQLNPVSFNMIGSSVDKAGFIAQEVEAVKPSLVNGGEVDENGNEIMRGVDYYGILAHAVKTIQELEARIATLESAGE